MLVQSMLRNNLKIICIQNKQKYFNNVPLNNNVTLLKILR